MNIAIAIAVCIAFLLLAALNAAFSQPPDAFILSNDKRLFVPPLLISEGFYRSFLINVAFLGIATVTSSFQFGTSTHFQISGLAMLAIVINLAWGFFAGLCLWSDSRQISNDRIKWVVGLVFAGIVFFVFSVGTVYHTATENMNPPQSSNMTPENKAKDGQKESQEG